MKFLWCDTETTGLKPENAAPFQIAFIFVSNIDGVKTETERVFMLNPFDIPGIEYSTDAAKVHGYSKEEIEKFFPSKQIVPKIAEFLESMKMFTKNEKMFFVVITQILLTGIIFAACLIIMDLNFQSILKTKNLMYLNRLKEPVL